jgi:opacity protein-like surface antigen
MKKITLLISLLLISVVIYAQRNNLVDVVYLKNGSILRGIIIEQVPNESIKLQTADGNIFVYQTNDIEKITKEDAIKQSRSQLSYGSNELQHRKGYIGLSIGPSFAIGDLSDLPVGAILNLVDFGYLFTDNIGVAAKWFGTAHTESGITFGVGGLMGGLLASTPISEKINFEGKALVGPGVFVASYDGESETSEAYFGYDLGVGLRFNTSEKVSLLLNADYIGVSDYSSINVTFGVAFRLK